MSYSCRRCSKLAAAAAGATFRYASIPTTAITSRTAATAADAATAATANATADATADADAAPDADAAAAATDAAADAAGDAVIPKLVDPDWLSRKWMAGQVRADLACSEVACFTAL